MDVGWLQFPLIDFTLPFPEDAAAADWLNLQDDMTAPLVATSEHCQPYSNRP